MADKNEEAWWRATQVLVATAIAALAVLALAPLLLSSALDRSTILGFGFGYFLATLVIPIVLAVGILLLARRQSAIDRHYDIGQD